MTNKNLLRPIARLLTAYPETKRYHISKLSVKPLAGGDKKSYWGTSVKKFIRVTDAAGTKDFNVEGTIYVNVRDTDPEKILRIVAHEMEHLLDDKPGQAELIYTYLFTGLGFEIDTSGTMTCPTLRPRV